MEHKLTLENSPYQAISVIEKEKEGVVIQIINDDTNESVFITKKELHSLIGTLLHVQQKIK